VTSTPSAGAVQDAAAHILDAVPEAYACFDSQFRYTFLNRAREQLLAHVCAFLRSSVCNPLKAQGRVSVFEKV